MAGTRAVLSLLQEVETATDQLRELQVGSRSAEPWESFPNTDVHSYPTPGIALTTHLYPGVGQLHSLWTTAGRHSVAAAEP